MPPEYSDTLQILPYGFFFTGCTSVRQQPRPALKLCSEMIKISSETAEFSLVKGKNNPRKLFIFMQTGWSMHDHTAQNYQRLLLVINELSFYSSLSSFSFCTHVGFMFDFHTSPILSYWLEKEKVLWLRESVITTSNRIWSCPSRLSWLFAWFFFLTSKPGWNKPLLWDRFCLLEVKVTTSALPWSLYEQREQNVNAQATG